MLIKMSSTHTSVTKNMKVAEEEMVAAPPTPPPLPPAAKKSVAGSSAKQGIVTILGSDNYPERTNKAASIRRTLSADMSSKKWLSQNGFASPPSIKKIASSDELAAVEDSSSSSDGEDDEVKRRSFDVWSSILQSNKTEDFSSSSQFPPPYIHPLVKKTANSLTGKSLEICTESLGCETGSDCFSSYPPSESGDSADGERDAHPSPPHHELISPSFSDEFPAAKQSYSKKSPPRSFPPPLPSLVRGDNQASVRMHSRRQHGRLILEAVSVPANNCFRAERQDGRLVLTFVNKETEEKTEEETEDRDADMVFDEMQDGEDNNPTIDNEAYEEEDEEEMGIVFGKSSKLIMNLNSFIALNNNNNNNKKLNRPAVNLAEDVELEDDQTPIPHSLPRIIHAPPQPAVAASFNPYEYFWRKKPTTIATLVHIPTITEQQNYNKVVTKCPKTSACEGKDHSLVLINKNNNNLILPMKNRGCKEPRNPRMSLFLWDSYCIATS